MSTNKINFLTNVPVYSNTGVYGYFDSVYVNSGANSGRYFVSQIETSYFDINQQDYAALTTFNGWYNISSPYATLNDLFQISYNQESDVDLSNRIVQLGEGYNKSINKLNFVNEGIKCKISPATLNETKAFLVFSELRNANSGFFFRNELQEANVDYYNISNLSVSQEYLDNFGLDFSVKRVFENNASYISNQTPQELPLTGKYDLYDFSEIVSGFDQASNGVQYTIDSSNYAIVYKFASKCEEVMWTFGNNDDSDIQYYNVAYGPGGGGTPMDNFINLGVARFDRSSVAAPYDLDRLINGVYLHPLMADDVNLVNAVDTQFSSPFPSDIIGVYADVFHKNIIGTQPYNFLVSPPIGYYQDDVENSVNLQTYFGSGTRLNKSDYYVKNVSIPYLNTSIIRTTSFNIVTSCATVATLDIECSLYRKNTPTSNQSDSTLVWVKSGAKTVSIEDNRDSYRLVFKIADVSDFSTVTSISIE